MDTHRIAGMTPNVFVSHPNSATIGPMPSSALYEASDFQLFVLNSGFYCARDQQVQHGKLGIQQLDWFRQVLLQRDLGKWGILMLHHHPFLYPYPSPVPDLSDLEEGAEVLESIGAAGIDFVCHGHRHHPIHVNGNEETAGKHLITFLCTGSMGVGPAERANGQIPNMCHWVNLRQRSTTGSAEGEIHSFEYIHVDGWTYAREVQTGCPINLIQSFGCDRNPLMYALLISHGGSSRMPLGSSLIRLCQVARRDRGYRN